MVSVALKQVADIGTLFLVAALLTVPAIRTMPVLTKWLGDRGTMLFALMVRALCLFRVFFGRAISG